MKSLSKNCPIGTSGGQGPLKKETAHELGAKLDMKGEPLPYKNSREASIARHGGNS
jgi:hypothetical protein